LRTSDFDYHLPPELIAQTPIEPRDSSRLMVVNRTDGSIAHRQFYEIADYLQAGDVLVLNDSRVMPARLKGRKVHSGGKVELLLLRQTGPGLWEALVKPGKRVNNGTRIEIAGGSPAGGEDTANVTAEVVGEGQDGIKVISLPDEERLLHLGEIPLPPYIHTPLAKPERYQTVYARDIGSAAAPTAGLHFTPELMKNLTRKGVQCLFVTLHVGLDTFRPVREDDPREHHIYQEYGVLSQEVATALSQAKAEGRRIIAAGTTTVRIVEGAAQHGNPLRPHPFDGWVSLYILPGYRFKMVDALITNFHLPRSTLLMLATAFAGKSVISRAYEEAIASRYRFYSFGDAMLIL